MKLSQNIITKKMIYGTDLGLDLNKIQAEEKNLL